MGTVLIANHLAFSVLNAGGWVCKWEGNLPDWRADETKSATVKISQGCGSTKIGLVAGRAYSLSMEFSKKEEEEEFTWWFPLLRKPFSKFLTPIARVGSYGLKDEVLDRKTIVYGVCMTPSEHGELFVFLNRPILGIPGLWDYFYRGLPPGEIQIDVTSFQNLAACQATIDIPTLE
jgi:hypothetical protein